MGNVTTYLK